MGGSLSASSVGETIDTDERVVVSPAAGLFTPFTGQLMAMTAVAGEHVHRCQRVAWLRQRA